MVGICDCESKKEKEQRQSRVPASEVSGVQKLIAAEKRGAEKINEARKRKIQRLKQAKQEAQAEIEKYRKEREKGFREFEDKYSGTRDDLSAQLKQETGKMLENMDQNVAANKQKVIVRLLQLVCDICPELHRNLQLQMKL